MESPEFVDYYETLEISPNAGGGAIERMFRYLAQRYHPDNPDTGDRRHFDAVVEAHNVLKDPAKRAEYDLRHKSRSEFSSKFVGESDDKTGVGRDIDIQDKLLSILYAKRRRNVRNAGVGDVELEGLLECSADHLEFHIWYMKEKGWIKRTEDGTLAITVEGIDHANAEHQRKIAEKLLIERRADA